MLITCPECTKDLSDTASTCPHCGYALTDIDRERGRTLVQGKKEADERAEQQRRSAAEKVSTDKVIRTLAIGGIVILVLFVMIRGCSTSEPKTSATICDRSEAWLYAQGAVEDRLKNPDDAEFHHPSQWKVVDDPKVAGQYVVTGEVTATNSFNAKLRQTFTAVVRCKRGTWYTGKVTMQ